MEITDVRIKKVDTPGKLRAYVSVTFDGCFVVHNLKIISGQSGVFIAMPSRRTKTGEYKDIAHPINPEFRRVVQERILQEFEAVADMEGDAAADRDEEGDENEEEQSSTPGGDDGEAAR